MNVINESPYIGIDSNISNEKWMKLLECPICYNFIIEPTQYGCGHTFCNVCAYHSNMKNCPLCQKRIQTRIPNWVMKNITENMIKCKCNNIYHPHKTNHMVMKDMESSLDNDSNESDESLLVRCEWSGLYKDYKTHILNCKLRPINCKYRKFGCKFRTINSKIQSHYNDPEQIKYHLELCDKKLIDNEKSHHKIKK